MKNLVAALIKARAAFKPIKKDRVNPHYKSQYATMDSVLGAVEDALGANGLTIIQTTAIEDGHPVLLTHLCHESGESINGTYLLPDNADPQKMGSAITYARRYALCAILSVTADEDDDGNAASKDSQGRSQSATPKTNPKPQRPQSSPTESSTLTTNRDRFIRLRTLTGHHLEQVKALCVQLNLPTVSNDLNPAQCLQLRDAMLIDWAMGRRRFNHVKHAQNSLDNVLTQFDQPPDDDTLWVVWEEKVLAKPVLEEAIA